MGRALGLTPFYRILVHPASALARLGWIKSVTQDAAVDAENSPIPWMTYPIISFLDERLRKDFRVFEYGAGNSTRWLAPRVQSIVSLEHDRHWVEKVAPDLPSNCAVHLREVNDSRSYGEMSFGDGIEENAYVSFIGELGERHDVIVVDGIHRLSCLRRCVDFLNAAGVLVVDNTNESAFAPMRQTLKQAGFREIPFHGMAPIQNWLSCSSVFYRRENCFEI